MGNIMQILQLIFRILYFFRIYMILSPQFVHNFENFAAKSINQKVAHTNISISELLLIQQQSDFISQIMKTQINSKKSHTFSTQISEMSFESNYFDKPRFLNSSVSTISLCKQNSKFFQEDSYDEALNQIKRYCSKKTYSYIRDKLRTRESRNEKKLQKEVRHNEQLALRCLKLTQEVGELKLKLQSANEKLKNEQKKKPVLGLNKSIDKGQVYLKWEKSILYKQKIQNEIKKNLNKQLNTLEAQRKQNELICYKIQNILARIEQGNGTNDGKTTKMIENISLYIKQRKSMKDQSKEYESIQKCVEETVQHLRDMIGNLK